jgi:hemin uptake protein HemP
MRPHVPPLSATPQVNSTHRNERAAAASPAPQRWSSRVLLADGREAEIEHEGAIYRLRLTALGKLILTK